MGTPEFNRVARVEQKRLTLTMVIISPKEASLVALSAIVIGPFPFDVYFLMKKKPEIPAMIMKSQ